MGQHISTLSSINTSNPSKCMVLEVTGRRNPQEQVLLLPVTPATMPNAQSPLCVMLNDSQNLPWVLQWAWPTIRVVEADRVLSSTIEPCSSERLPLEATFAHALPGQGSGSVRQRTPATGIEVGHLMSFIAVETPAGFPLPMPALAPVGDQQNSTFFEFTDSWMNSLCRTEGCSVVGYFRYLQLVDESSEEDANTRTFLRPHTQVVGVMDHYVYKSFRSEARALMLLQSVSFYLQQLGCEPGNETTLSDSTTSQPPSRVVMRCKSRYLPQLRLMQKLYRMVHLADSKFVIRQGPPAVGLQYVGNNELLHVYFRADSVPVLLDQLADGIRFAPTHSYATIGYDTTQLPPLETPFDPLIAQTREKWRLDNEPFKAKDRPNSRTTIDRYQQDYRAAPCSDVVTPIANSAPLFPVLRSPTPCGFPSTGEGSVTSLTDGHLLRRHGSGYATTSMTSTPPSFSSEAASSFSRPETEGGQFAPPLSARPVNAIVIALETPIQFSNGDGVWGCGFWVEPLEVLYLHWFDPSTDQTALLEHWGPITVRNMAGEYELITPTQRGKVYIAVAPHVEVLGYSSSSSLSEPATLASVFASARNSNHGALV
jgi:hypothetical protein